MSDEHTMFDVEPMSWEETATRLQEEKIALRDEIAALTVERDELREQSHSFITGSIPPSPITKDTEIVFVAGQAFVNAAKHEETVGRIAGERDALKAELDAKDSQTLHLTADILTQRDEAIRERDASVCHASALAEHRDRLREELNSVSPAALRFARQDVATLLEAIGRVTGLRGTTEPWASRLSALHDVANEIAKRTGYAGGQGDG